MQRAEVSIIERDSQLGSRLAAYLVEHGYQVDIHPAPLPLLHHLPFDPPGMVLLGDGEWEGGGLALLRRIRAVSRVPCVVLSTAEDEMTHIISLDAGADDVVCRDAPPRAILARLKAVLRRAEWGAAEEPGGRSVDGWSLLLRRRQLLRPDGSECVLTTAEFNLMRILVEANGDPVTREAIAEAVFQRPYRTDDRTVDNLVLRLRRKLGPGQESAVKTVRGAGYMFAGFASGRLRVA